MECDKIGALRVYFMDGEITDMINNRYHGGSARDLSSELRFGCRGTRDDGRRKKA